MGCFIMNYNFIFLLLKKPKKKKHLSSYDLLEKLSSMSMLYSASLTNIWEGGAV